jgi:hypothetical protein
MEELFLGAGGSLSDELYKDGLVFFNVVDVGSSRVVVYGEGVGNASQGVVDFVVYLVVGVESIKMHAQG